ncbi:AP-4-A phosphorylase [Limihaloglobus sulfuriphilus]|uniref:AP-4-A phosphorylase n=2 Tax=Limihaloglobus sulfuriphilus TaxID=1851148 RepID=A0A1Q2MDM4_9BACT|nr:AP-4-A phosphorylase [Limihaloglobus sulfuriphilus]
MTLQKNNIWAPWRMAYIKDIEKSDECFLCAAREDRGDDREKYVLWRTELSIVVFNRFPYNNGHLLIAPKRHIPDLETAAVEEIFDIATLARDTQIILKKAISPQGFNVGLNIGRCAGAGLPGHLHMHIVPRWDGDTGFMSTCSEVEVISQSMDELYDMLIELSGEMNLPSKKCK